jgi:hypothetical protein
MAPELGDEAYREPASGEQARLPDQAGYLRCYVCRSASTQSFERFNSLGSCRPRRPSSQNRDRPGNRRYLETCLAIQDGHQGVEGIDIVLNRKGLGRERHYRLIFILETLS